MELPTSPELGPCTLNIGIIEGGEAPNVVPPFARAHLFYRLVGPSDELKRRIIETVGNRAEVTFVLEIPFVRLRTVHDIPTMVAAFTTDIPRLSNWGEPVLLGPGSIHVAHTERERVEKCQLQEAMELYCKVARKLVSE
jgi:acetylornithine deacetylase